MTFRKLIPVVFSAFLCVASCDFGSSPGGGTEGEGLTGILQDPHGLPVAGALVRVFPDAGTGLSRTATKVEATFDSTYTNAKGEFKLDSLPEGNYGLLTSVRKNDTSLVLLVRGIAYDGEEQSLGTRMLQIGGILRLGVRSSVDRQSLADAACKILGAPFSATTDSSGYCVFDGLPPGNYTVLVSHPGYVNIQTGPLHVVAGGITEEGPWELPNYPVPLDKRVLVPASADAVINGGTPSTAYTGTFSGLNYGRAPSIGAATYDIYTTWRTLLRFSLPARYRASDIQSAVIRISTTRWVQKNTQRPFRIDIHRVLKSWKEGTANGALNSAAVDGVTSEERFWGSQNGSENWSRSLLALDDIDAASQPTASVTKAVNSTEYWEFDVTALAKAWALDSSVNFGVLLASAFPTSNAEAWDYPEFHSREALVADSLRPVLILNGEPVSTEPPAPASSVSLSIADVAIGGPVPGQPDNNGRLNKNFGTDTLLGTACYDIWTCARSLFRFKLPPGQTSASIQSATFRITPQNWVSKNVHTPFTLRVHRMLKSWKEGTGSLGGASNSASVDGATGLEPSWGAADWATSMAAPNDIDASTAVIATVTRSAFDMNAWDFDVTELVKAWAADTSQNFGLLLDTDFPANNESVKSFPQFHTRESGAVDSLKPLLILNR